MNRKLLTLLAVPLMAVALAASAMALVPGLLNTFSAAPPAADSVGAPAWKAGDTWTYNVSLAALDARQVLPGAMLPTTASPVATHVFGTITETVVGSVPTDYGAAWNTTVVETMRFGQMQPMGGAAPQMGPLGLPAVAINGFVWYRQSDLAPIYSMKSITLGSSWTTNGSLMFGAIANGTYSLQFVSTTQVWYHPALAVLHFPLEENATWNVSSNATIRYDSSFEFLGPNVTFETHHTANFTVPVGFTVRTGGLENVTTPAGTFHAMSVSALRRDVARINDPDAGAIMNLTADTDLEMPHAFATAWFSSQVGNVVKVEFGPSGIVGPRVDLDLVSYSYS